MWIKFILAGLIIAFCTLLGYFAAGKYRARRDLFAEWNSFNERFLSELAFARKPLSEFVGEGGFKGDFGKKVAEFSQKHDAESKFIYLTKEENAELKNYLSMLGKGDARAQSAFFSAQSKRLADAQATGEKEAKSRCELYLKLGLLAGLAFVILII